MIMQRGQNVLMADNAAQLSPFNINYIEGLSQMLGLPL